VHEDIEQRASAHQTVDALGLDQTELTEEARILAAERVRTRPPQRYLPSPCALVDGRTHAMTVTHPDLTGAELERLELVPRASARRATFTLMSSTRNASRLR
jgi:hypothetical protein